MNRGEQETLYIQARNLRLQQESKAQHNNPHPRHHSYGNIHQIQQVPKSVSRNFRSALGNDDLVLSVLKSPLRDQSLLSNLSSIATSSIYSESVCDSESVNRLSTLTTLTTATVDNNAPSPQSGGHVYSTLRSSEDELVDDVESALETTELNENRCHLDESELSPYSGLKFLKRFRTTKLEPHHRRVPTPMKRKNNRSRSKSSADILDGVDETNDETDEVAITNGTHEMDGGWWNISKQNIAQFSATTIFSRFFSHLKSRKSLLPDSITDRSSVQSKICVPPSARQNFPGALLHIFGTSCWLDMFYLPFYRVSSLKNSCTEIRELRGNFTSYSPPCVIQFLVEFSQLALLSNGSFKL